MDLPLPPPRLTPAQTAFALLAAVPLLIAVFVPVPTAVRGPVAAALFDFSHFSLAAGACWFLWGRLGWDRWAAFAAVIVAAALCEVLQGFTGRSPNASDFLRGLFGASAMVVCLSAFRPSIPTARWIGAMVVLIAVSAWPISEFLLAAAKICVRVG